MKTRQTILGAGGDIGRLLAQELSFYTKDIQLVSRNPQKINPTDVCTPVDLMDSNQVVGCLEESAVAYLTVGLKYSSKIWQKQWPIIMDNVIDACVASGCKLVFFDNIYMYAPDGLQHMKEDCLHRPSSKKGKVRKALNEKLKEAREKRGLEYLIARSADFYGPGAKNGVLNVSVIESFNRGKMGFWQIRTDKVHSMTYTLDAARATALLGNTPSAFGQVWHLPTSAQLWTVDHFISEMEKQTGRKARVYVLKKWMMKGIGFFVPLVKELYEMSYQYDRDYFFDSQKFQDAFEFRVTPYEEGVKKCLTQV